MFISEEHFSQKSQKNLREEDDLEQFFFQWIFFFSSDSKLRMRENKKISSAGTVNEINK